jgi:hypothetical protein
MVNLLPAGAAENVLLIETNSGLEPAQILQGETNSLVIVPVRPAEGIRRFGISPPEGISTGNIKEITSLELPDLFTNTLVAKRKKELRMWMIGLSVGKSAQPGERKVSIEDQKGCQFIGSLEIIPCRPKISDLKVESSERLGYSLKVKILFTINEVIQNIGPKFYVHCVGVFKDDVGDTRGEAVEVVRTDERSSTIRVTASFLGDISSGTYFFQIRARNNRGFASNILTTPMVAPTK